MNLTWDIAELLMPKVSAEWDLFCNDHQQIQVVKGITVGWFGQLYVEVETANIDMSLIVTIYRDGRWEFAYDYSGQCFPIPIIDIDDVLNGMVLHDMG